ncbi:MAG: hypothetical protein WBG86_02200 [Polyangiales bacterium]
MPCDHVSIDTPDGPVNAIVCNRQRRAKCSVCRKKAGTRLCDAPLERVRYARKTRSKTCDKPLCDDCAIVVGENTDVCPGHERWAQPLADQGSLEGIL